MDTYEYPPEHPKWFGVPPKGQLSAIGDRSLHLQVLVIVSIAVFIFVIPFIFLTKGPMNNFSLLINIAVYTISVPFLFALPIFLFWKFTRKPIHKSYVFQVLVIILVEIGIWAIYRKSTADYFEGFGTFQMYAFHIVFAPTIHLLPIIFFWKFWRKESGLPFVFSKRLLLSGLIAGFMAAIMWRVLEEFIYDGLAAAAGGVIPGTFTFWNLLETPNLFVIMTFVHFFIVGPVEELEFRGFTQDQAARVLPNWQAVTFSSVLFGCSHIPIAIFLYRFSPSVFLVALIGWISAGFVFGFLYMWSRNIYACIVMHGMGNWQLSVFYFQSITYLDWSASNSAIIVGTITSVIANFIMIIFFYAIHKFYWEPHRRGEPAFNGALMKLQTFVHEHDFGQRPVTSTLAVATVFSVIICGIFVGAAASFGDDPGVGYINMYASRLVEEESSTLSLDDLVEVEEQMTGSGQLDEGTDETITISSQEGKYIKSVLVTVSWTDEADIQRVRTYENNPDTFTLTAAIVNESESATASNAHGQEGQVSAELSFEIEDVEIIIENEGDAYSCEVTISMDDAGDLYPPVGLIIYTDSGNAYDYIIDIVWLSAPDE